MNWQDIFHSLGQLAFILAPDHTIIEVNQATLNTLKSLREDIVGKKCHQIFHGSGTPPAFCPMDETVLTGIACSRTMDVEIFGKPCIIACTPLRDEEGRVEKILHIATDVSDLRKTQSALADSEIRFRGLFEQAGLGVCLCRMDGTFHSTNPKFCEITGYTAEELAAMTFRELTHPDDLMDDEANIRRLLKGKIDSYVMEKRYVRKDRGHTWVELTVSLLRNNAGLPDYFIGFIEDIAERRDTLTALQTAADIIATIPSGLFVWKFEEPDRLFLQEANPEATRLTGIGLEQWKDREMGEIWQPSDLEDLRRNLCSPLKTGQVYEAERVAHQDNRVEQAWRLRAFALPGQRLGGAFEDITGRKQAEEELQHAHERLLAILDGIDADIYVSDLDTHEVLFINRHMRDTFGTCSEGDTCWKVFRGQSAPCEHCNKPKLLNGDGSPADTIVWEGFNDISGRWHLNHDRAISWLEGRMVHIRMAADITDLKILEEELKRANIQAKAANTSKSEFLATMSHEVRTPLNGILGILNLLQLADLAPENAHYVEQALLAGKRLSELLADILDISAMEAGRLKLDPAAFRLADTLASVESLFLLEAQNRGIALSISMSHLLPETMVGDELRLRQILLNLVGNALKFTQSGSVSIEVHPLLQTDPTRCHVLFRVADTGIGIPDELLDGLFAPFTQADQSYRRRFQGAGLGLNICKRLVALMKGFMSVESEEGLGTSIYVSIPFEVGEDIVLDASQTECRFIPPKASCKVLLVEDDSVNQLTVTRLLMKLGCDVRIADHGRLALELLRQEPFDVVLMDVQMPVMDGVEATGAIRAGEAGKSNRTIPIVALTAYAMTGDRKKFLDAGMDGYLPKPVDIKNLEKTLKRILNK